MTTRAPKTRTAQDPVDDGILRLTSSTAKPVEEARRVLFVIDDEEFTVPKVIDERLVYLALDSMRDDGVLFSGQRLVELLLDKPQYKRLLAHYERRAITQENFDAIVTAVTNLFFDHINRDEEAPGKATPSS